MKKQFLALACLTFALVAGCGDSDSASVPAAGEPGPASMNDFSPEEQEARKKAMEEEMGK
ncbi:hypothetical protein Poly51_47080 [Rubripirellula tenax]|uniref:Secreted protein n=1 Tax=Rubripirellula tenax TaxID=2528015 RepID=A0A5C6EJS6_9BACT|nr:hypothetical protein [Rubripirellula tenax]TWU48804.1 hypothetical protein Poly51_47080 [Rubripirellula tenax]